jgi:ribonuclease P protein component
MLPKRYRLRHRSDVQRVQRQGRRFRHPLAILLVSPSSAIASEKAGTEEMDGQLMSRFAFVASRRVGSAVTRNRAKRLLREALRSHIKNIQPGWDGMFIAREATPQASMPEIEKAVGSLLSRAKILLTN